MSISSIKKFVLQRRSLILQNLMSYSKVTRDLGEAISHVKSGDTIISGGFGLCGLPYKLFLGLSQKPSIKNLTFIGCTFGNNDYGPALLIEHNQLKKAIGTYIGECDDILDQYWGGNIEVEVIPQGTMAEKFRCGSSGIPAFYTPSGVDTIIEYGGFVSKYNCVTGEPEIITEGKESKFFSGRKYLLEEAIQADIAFVKGWKSDPNGNIICKGAAKNFNVDAAGAAKICIAEVEEVVELGEIDPHHVDIHGIHVDIVYVPEPYEKKIEFYNAITKKNEEDSEFDCDKKKKLKVSELDILNMSVREKIARRVALEFEDGMYANLGIGIPTLSGNYLPEGVDVILHSENGIIGIGPFPIDGTSEVDADFVNASKQLVTLVKGSSLFSSSTSFGFIRGSHVDITILGAMEVSQRGDLANWIIPGKLLKGMGGAMDLVSSAKNVIVTMEHCDKHGNSKIKQECSLPLTGSGVVDKLITELAVFEFKDNQMILKEKAFWIEVNDIIKLTEANFTIDKHLKDMEYSL